MATGTVQSPAPPPVTQVALTRPSVAVIERQLGRTKFHVRLVDLLARFAVLLVGVLGFLLVAALVDHWWVLPLGTWGRTIAFFLLFGGVMYYIWTQLATQITLRINDTDTAHAIEM